MVLMHRQITGASQEEQVDHRDRNGLNNTRENLRIASSQQNAFNRGKRNGEFKGVSKCRRKWRARITIDGKEEYLGVFSTPEEAARVYDRRARELFGEFAVVNFPKGGERE